MRAQGQLFVISCWNRAAIVAALSVASSTAVGDVRFVRADAPANGDGTSWATAYTKVFEALDDAAKNPGVDQIWVAAGTYTPDRGRKNRNDTFTLLPGVAVYGGFDGTETLLDERDPIANPTILSGDLKKDDGANFTKISDNSFHVLSAANFTSAPALLAGVTVKAGNANLDPDDLLGGGGLFIQGAVVSVEDCLFTGNSAGINQPSIGGFGGAIYNLGGTLTAIETDFIANRADNGGAFGLRDDNDSTYAATFINCDFLQNKANNQTGGAIWTGANPFDTVERSLTIQGCLFEGNSAQYGGAIIEQNSKHVTITDTVFRNNKAFVVAGAMWHNQTSGNDQEPMFVSRCTFEDNVAADHGGGIFLTLADAVVVNSRFIGNVAENGVGGGIRSGPQFGTNFGVGDLFLTNCEFTGNDALFGGGVAALRCPIARVDHCTFAQNTASSTAAGLFSDSLDLDINNSIFWQNAVGASVNQNAQLVHQATFGPLSINNTCVQGLTAVLGGSDNISDDPLFTDIDGADDLPGTVDDDLTLGKGSPAVDAANVLAIPADTVDLDGDGDKLEPAPVDLAENDRLAGPAPDMGCFESQAVVVAGDLDGDGLVNGSDLGLLLSNWGGSGAGDLNGDDLVDGVDLGLLLAAWTG